LGGRAQAVGAVAIPIFLAAILPLHALAAVQALTALLGEATLYHVLGIGLFLMGAGAGARLGTRFSRGKGASGAVILAAVGGTSAVGILVTASLSLRARSAYLGELHTRYAEDVSVWEVLRRFDVGTLKAFVSSPLPSLGLAAVWIAAIGAAGALALGSYASSPARFRPVAQGAACLGAVAIFAFLLLPCLTPIRISPALGVLTAFAAWGMCVAEGRGRRLTGAAVATLVGLGLILVVSGSIERYVEANVTYDGEGTEVVARLQTPRQRVAIVRSKEGRLTSVYRNHYLQYTLDAAAEAKSLAIDNHHNVLVHTALALHPAPREVLVLGGGDGVTAAEVLRHPQVKLTVVDPDREWFEFARSNADLRRMNRGALDDPRTAIRIEDPFAHIRGRARASYDVILKDFPEGVGETLARSLSVEFFRDCRRVLRPAGILAVHSDFYGTGSFWTVARTLRAAGFAYVVAVNDDFSSPDALEGILFASNSPFPFARLRENPVTRVLIQAGVLPSAEKLFLDSNTDLLDRVIRESGADTNSLLRPTYLSKLRADNGFFLPTIFPVGMY